jgi:hypothetical protein
MMRALTFVSLLHRRAVRTLAVAVGSCCVAGAVLAHHTYAVFDMTKAASIDGRFAKMVWTNPHIALWVYVPKPGKKGEYDLWQFQSDSVNMAQRHGWTKDVLKTDERITLSYFPMRNNKENGGYLIRVVRADGTELIGDPNAPGVAKELAKTNSLPKQVVK